jgi:hypothetical protein
LVRYLSFICKKLRNIDTNGKSISEGYNTLAFHMKHIQSEQYTRNGKTKKEAEGDLTVEEAGTGSSRNTLSGADD